MQATRDELYSAQLQARVAVDLAPLISTMIDDSDGRLVVVADVVDCWLYMPDDVRAAYEKAWGDAGISHFVGDYVDGIDCAWPRSYQGDPETVGFHEAESLCLRNWRRHEAAIRRRVEAQEPPSPAWIDLITANQCGKGGGAGQ